MTKHAKLSASSSARWLACPPSVKLSAGFPDKESTYALEGTDAHELCEYLLRKALGEAPADPRENLTFYNAEMQSAAEGYMAFVMEHVAEARRKCKDAKVMVEQRLDYSDFVPEGFGTGDCVILADGKLFIIDFKYGLGVLVSADHNSQMMCYALGALQMFGALYDITSVSLNIYQPRRQNISTFEISKDDLLAWGQKVLKPTAELAMKGEGEFKAGPHCRFCKAKAVCRKRAEYNLEMARYDFKMPDVLGDDEIAAVLQRADELAAWAEEIKRYALKKAIGGTAYAGFKVVEGRSVRKYTSEADVVKAVIAEGLNPYEKKVLGITAMTALLGKKRFKEILGNLIYKPPGKPVLVPESDPRPVWNNANADFKEEKQ